MNVLTDQAPIHARVRASAVLTAPITPDTDEYFEVKDHTSDYFLKSHTIWTDTFPFQFHVPENMI